MRVWERWAPLAGIAAVVLWVIAFAVSGESPDSTEETAAYYRENETEIVTAYFLIAAGILLFIWFLSLLRTRLGAAEGEPARVAPLAFGAGLVTAALLFVANSLFIAPAIIEEADFDAAAARMLETAGYATFVGSVMVGAVLVAATSVVALRRRAFPAWFGWVGLVAAVVLLFAVAFFPVFVLFAWILVASALMVWRPGERARG